MDTNSDFYTAAKRYVQAAIELLAKHSSEVPPEPSGLREYVRTSENTFELRQPNLPYWPREFWSQAKALHALPEYESFVARIRSEPKVARYINVLVGTHRGSTSFRIEELADHLAYKMAEKCGRLAFDSAQFDALIASYYADIQADEIELVAVAPIPGFKSEAVPIALTKNLEIDRLTDEEISRCLRVGISPGMEMGGMVHVTGKCGVRYRFVEKKIFGGQERDLKAFQRAHESMIGEFLSVSHGLRLFKRGRVSIPALAIFTEHWPVDGMTGSGAIEPTSGHGNMYELSTKDGLEFQSFWNAVARARETPFLDAAVRRFGYAGERHRPEDRLVDLMICAESLFLSDAGETKERGEMRFRVSLRFGLFAEIEKYSRTDGFRLIRNAYDARSALVHGGNPDDDDLKLPNVGRVPLAKFVDEVEDALRGALHKAITIKPFAANKLVDWESLALG